MSTELYEVISLFARYLFALLGVLIVLWAFVWLSFDRGERRKRLRQLPSSGMIGEFIVLSAGRDLRQGSVIAVPWEGVLGSVRSCDLFVPEADVRRKHLAFSFEPGLGLLARPFSGCEATVDGTLLDCHSRPQDTPLRHGSFLQVGQALLRLRVYAGLDASAGFEPLDLNVPGENPENMVPQVWEGNGSGESLPPTHWVSSDGIPAYGYSPQPVDAFQPAALENPVHFGNPQARTQDPNVFSRNVPSDPRFPDISEIPVQGSQNAPSDSRFPDISEIPVQGSRNVPSDPRFPDIPEIPLQGSRNVPSDPHFPDISEIPVQVSLKGNPNSAEALSPSPDSTPASRRRRRSDRWEADWSE